MNLDKFRNVVVGGAFCASLIVSGCDRWDSLTPPERLDFLDQIENSFSEQDTELILSYVEEENPFTDFEIKVVRRGDKFVNVVTLTYEDGDSVPITLAAEPKRPSLKFYKDSSHSNLGIFRGNIERGARVEIIGIAKNINDVDWVSLDLFPNKVYLSEAPTGSYKVRLNDDIPRLKDLIESGNLQENDQVTIWGTVSTFEDANDGYNSMIPVFDSIEKIFVK